MCNEAGPAFFRTLESLDSWCSLFLCLLFVLLRWGVSWAYQLVRPSGHAASIVQRWLMFVCCRGVEPRSTCKCPRHGRGSSASSGLLEIQTSSGSYGSVCGMNAEAASVACRQLGFEFGVQSPSPCGQYGGESWCGAAGSPVAVKSLKCLGTEMSVDECSSEVVDEHV